MLLRRFTDFILQGRFQAIGCAFVLAFIPIIAGISVLIAALVTLRKGIFEGALVALAATLPSWIAVYTVPSGSPVGGDLMVFAGAGLITACNLFTWVLAGLLRRYGNWSFILELSLVIGILFVGVVHIAYPDVQSWWGTQLNAYLGKTVSAMSGVTADEASAPVKSEVQARLVLAVKPYATGFLAVSVLFNALLQLGLARWWQAVVFNPGGLREELRKIRLNYAVGVLFAVGCLLSYFGNETVLDTMPVFFSIFAVAGLSLVHSLAALTKTTWLWLVLVYASVILVFQPAILILAVMAFLDIWMDFRKRFRVIER